MVKNGEEVDKDLIFKKEEKEGKDNKIMGIKRRR